MRSPVLIIEESPSASRDDLRVVPWGPPASVCAIACADRTVYCDECKEPAAGQCAGCGKCLCVNCIERHRRPGPRSECSGRWNEPRADEATAAK